MRRLAWALLLLFVFAIPWEYSLDLGTPWGNVARIAGLATLAVSLLSVLQAGRIRPPRVFHIAALLWLLWLCCTAFWSIDPRATAGRLPGYVQEMMIVWLVWELVETEDDVDAVLRAYLAGSAVLACWTIGSFLLHPLTNQVRFAPEGQDPNDVARYLVMGLPFAAWLADSSRRRADRILAVLCLPLMSMAVLFTASRSGFLACAVSLVGCGAVLWRRHPGFVIAGTVAAPAGVMALWLVAPHAMLLRLGSIPGQLMGGDLNQRLNIWAIGWSTFTQAPVVGWGAGSFVWAAHVSAINTAHNTPLAIAVEGGVVSLTLALCILAACVSALLQARHGLRLALGTALVAWSFLSLVSTVQENRTTWLLLGIIVVAGRLGMERRDRWRFSGRISSDCFNVPASPEEA